MFLILYGNLYKTVTNSIFLLQVLEHKCRGQFVLHILLCGGKTHIFIKNHNTNHSFIL